MLKTCLVTGSNGFIGQHLCKALSERGYRVYKLFRSGDVHEQFDIRMELGVDKIPEGLPRFDVVFHLAGKAHDVAGLSGLEEYRKANVYGTQQLLEYVKEGGIFVLFSSLAVMPLSKSCLDETTPPMPTSDYGKSKLEAEELVMNWLNKKGKGIILRPAMVYGETKKGNLPRMIGAISKGLFPPLPEINTKRSMVSVEDLVQAAILVTLNENAIGKTYIITDGKDCSSSEISEYISLALNKKKARIKLPLFILKLVALVGDVIGHFRGRPFIFNSDVFQKLIGSACYSSAKIQHELGFKPQHNLEQSLPEIIKYLKL